MLSTKSASAWSSTRSNPSASNALPTARTHSSWLGEVDVPQIAYFRMRGVYRGVGAPSAPGHDRRPHARSTSFQAQRKRSRSARHHEVAGTAVAGASTPRTIAAGHAVALAHHELGRTGDLVGDCDHRRPQLVAAASCEPRRSLRAPFRPRRARRPSCPGATPGRTSRSRSRPP